MRSNIKNIIVLALGLIICLPISATSLPAFEAHFDIYRNGKLTGKQTTILRQLDNNSYELTDITTATKGIASTFGFKRKETSKLLLKENKLFVLKHRMNQKIAFKKKQFSFDKKDIGYTVTHKNKTYNVPTIDDHPLAAHTLPYALAMIACEQPGTHQFSVLKSEKIKEYQFTSQLTTDGQLIVNRTYLQPSKRQTTMWLNPENDCLPLKTVHKEGKDSEIETRLTYFQSVGI